VRYATRRNGPVSDLRVTCAIRCALCAGDGQAHLADGSQPQPKPGGQGCRAGRRCTRIPCIVDKASRIS
jgi:hypothetical protein